MAQVWVTYEELAVLCACSTSEARANVRMRNWPQRQCSDGQARLKLPEDLAYAYMIDAVGRPDTDRVADFNVSGLQSVLKAAKAARGEIAA